MPEFRKDPLSDRWVIIAEGREGRPDEFQRTSSRRVASRCPFCAGHEEDTPRAIAVYDATHPALGLKSSKLTKTNQHVPAQPQQTEESACPTDHAAPANHPWLVRVVPNKYPAIDTAGDNTPVEFESFYEARPAIGVHEVIVESPRHVARFGQLTDDEARLLVLAYRDRIKALQQDSRLRYALAFKNTGPEAGASLEHGHSQIVATPLVPLEVQRELDAARRLYTEHGDCFFCRMVRAELEQDRRVVGQSPHFVAICPFASRMPFEMCMLPRKHLCHFELLGDETLFELAQFMHYVLKRLETIRPHAAYNYFIHTAPFDTLPLRHYHWHIEIYPRLTTTAGFEWGTGYFINPVPPEKAALALRSG